MDKKNVSYLVFPGTAKVAMNWYTSILPNAKIEHLEFYPNKVSGGIPMIKKGVFTWNGQSFECTDSLLAPDTSPIPAVSFAIVVASEKELHTLTVLLSQDGNAINPLQNDVSDSICSRFIDRFGISWELRLPSDLAEESQSNVCMANSPEVRPEYREFQ